MNLKAKLQSALGGEDERAVSPVIGVILMVAITVILAAVIATFVTGLGGSVDQSVQAGATAQFDPVSDKVTVTFTSGQNAKEVEVRAKSGGSVSATGGTLPVTLSDVGGSVTISGDDGKDVQIIVTAIGEDGGKTVVLDKTDGL